MARGDVPNPSHDFAIPLHEEAKTTILRSPRVDIKEVVIIGAGPAGIAAAIQLRRYHIEPLLLERKAIGGLLKNAYLVENYPGFPEGVKGLDLVELFEKQLKNAGVTVSFESVQKLDYGDKVFFTKTNRRVIRSDVAVIATGTRPRKFSAPVISDDIGDRIFYEIYPILGVKHKKIAIIGAGDAAFDYALNLSQENEVIIFNRNKRAACIPVLRERCGKSEKISYFRDVTVSEIQDQDGRLRLAYTSGDGQNGDQLSTDIVVIAIGREPCLDFYSNELKKYSESLVKKGLLYMVGDVKNDIYRQTAICVGDGIRAAMKIYKILRGRV
jgi:thioredoxin reductase (NADPH)